MAEQETNLDELDNAAVDMPVNRLVGMNGAFGAPLTPVQQIKTSYSTAVACQIKRELHDVKRRIEDEAKLAGEDFFYGWGAGKDRIEGPSVKLATALARCWGNCAIELQPIQEMPDAWIFTAVFVDLETGFTLPRQFRQAKNWTVYGKMDAARKDDIRFQIGQSKAIRNVILNALPASLVERAMKAAKSGVRQKLETFIKEKSLPAAQDLLLSELKKNGVSEEAVLKRYRVASKSALDVEILITMRGDIAAIQDGQERAEDLYPLEGETKEPNGKQADRLASQLKKDKEQPKQEEKAEEPKPEAKEEQKPEAKEQLGAASVPKAPKKPKENPTVRAFREQCTKEQIPMDVLNRIAVSYEFGTFESVDKMCELMTVEQVGKMLDSISDRPD